MPDSPESRCPFVLMSLKTNPRIDAVAAKRRRSSNCSKNELQRMHFLRYRSRDACVASQGPRRRGDAGSPPMSTRDPAATIQVPDDTTCISGLLCRKISQAFGQRFVARLPPELLVMVQR